MLVRSRKTCSLVLHSLRHGTRPSWTAGLGVCSALLHLREETSASLSAQTGIRLLSPGAYVLPSRYVLLPRFLLGRIKAQGLQGLAQGQRAAKWLRQEPRSST